MAKKYSKERLKTSGRVIWIIVGLMMIVVSFLGIRILLNVYDYFP